MSVETTKLRKAATGVQGLDEILGGGLPAGRPTLVCGSAGCGKTLLAMEFIARGASEFGEPGVFMAFEETARELAENVTCLGFDLDELVRAGRVRLDHVHVDRNDVTEAGEYDLEGLFIRLRHAIDAVGARRVVLDSLELLFGGLRNPTILRSEMHGAPGRRRVRGPAARDGSGGGPCGGRPDRAGAAACDGAAWVAGVVQHRRTDVPERCREPGRRDGQGRLADVPSQDAGQTHGRVCGRRAAGGLHDGPGRRAGRSGFFRTHGLARQLA